MTPIPRPRDAGEERYGGSSPPGGVLPGTLREVALRDPLHSTLPVTTTLNTKLNQQVDPPCPP